MIGVGLMKTIYLIRHSSPFVDIDNYSDYKNVLWEEYNKNMILSIEGEENAKKLCNVKGLNNVREIYASNSFRAIATAKYIAESNNLKIKLDNRINEREFGVDYLKELPENFTIKSFEDNNFKTVKGESLNELNKRFSSFIEELVNSNKTDVAVVIHGIIFLSYLQSISSSFEYDGQSFKILFKDKVILNGKLKSPDVYKLEFDKNNILVNVYNNLI